MPDQPLHDHLAPPAAGGVLDGGDEVARLDAAVPIALLPVRLETRFGTDGGKPCLRVRVYPDEIMADNHEPALTAEEETAGQTYWQSGWRPEREAQAWQALLVRYSAPRAAWVVRATTPTNVSARPDTPPVFPQVPRKADAWTRPVLARVLPDHWTVVCLRGGAVVHRVDGGPIPDPLALTVSPAIDPDDDAGVVDISGDGLRVDRDVLWTVDYDAALAVGMGVTVPGLTAADLAGGFDRVLVYGVKAGLAPDQGAKRLAELLDAHHYGRGLAFVPQGTPTNNTGEATSGFPPPDPNGAASFAVERGASGVGEGSAGAAFAGALGVDAATVGHVAGAARGEQVWARDMNRALWPVTWGYFLEQLMDPLVPAATVDAARRFFVSWVRGRGPLPAFRVGATPYGVLPVSSLARWQSDRDADAVTAALPQLLRRLLPTWSAGVAAVPRVGTGDPDQALLDVLAMDASAREVWIRPLLGDDASTSLGNFLNVQWPARRTRQQALGAQLQELWGGGPLVPRVVGAVFQDDPARFKFPFVAEPLSETASLAFNYLAWLRGASAEQLRAEQLPAGVATPTALLYRLLRHATLLEFRRAALDLLDRVGALAARERREPELVGIVPGTEQRPTVWARLSAPVRGVTQDASLGDYLHQAAAQLATPPARLLAAPVTARRPAIAATPETALLAEQRAALDTLAPLPTAELDRLMSETLDTCAHRLDAWITALYTQRLQARRAAHATGIHLGAFAWVEDLRPRGAPATRALRDGRVAMLQPDSGGYVHAPSIGQAAAAAVLRNGFLSRAGGDPLRYALDGSSARVRQARALLGAVREGQSLRAALGYQFERGLHQRALEQYIEPFRTLYPLPEADDPGGGAPAPRDVVDALKLRADAEAGTVPFGTAGLPSQDPDLAGVRAELTSLSESFDALSDLMTAEAVFQLVRGSTTGASASLDAQAQGVRPPDPDIVKFPRGGTPLTHRWALVLGGDPLPDAWPGVAASPRSAAEPYLDRWLAALIGDPSTVRARVQHPAPQPGDPDHVDEQVVTLAALGLRPSDLLALARAVAADDAGATLDPRAANPLADGNELDRRLVVAAVGWAPAPVRHQVLYAAAPGWVEAGVRTFPQILELLRAVQDVLGKARALGPSDLVPAGVQDTADADPLVGEADARAAQAQGALGQAATALDQELAARPAPDLAALRAALVNAARFGAAPFPALPLPDAAAEQARLLASATAASVELARRRTAAAAAGDAGGRAQAVFGADFRLLPRFVPAAAPALQAALDHGPDLGADDGAKARWFQQVQRVRPALAAWGRVQLYARCLGAAPGTFALAQLPHQDGARWVGLPFGAGEAPVARRTSLCLQGAAPPAAATPWVGLWIDEWGETIPATSATTGVAFNYDDPGAEAAQAVLLAVCPTTAARWDRPSLEATLLETFELARVRAVHGDVPADVAGGLADLSQLLPAIYLATNAAGDTVSTELWDARINQAAIVEEG
jgi:hypothetical protein